MNRYRAAWIARHGLLIGLATLVIGALTGRFGWALAGVLASYLSWMIWQTWRLQRWLQTPDQDAPDSRGVWGDIFDSLYRQQRRHRQSLNNMQAVLHRIQSSTAALDDAVIMLDKDGNLEWWNITTERMLGLKTPQDIGQPITHFVRQPRFVRYFLEKNYQEPLELPSPMNNGRYLQFYTTLYGDGEHLMLVRDVTRMHQLEQMRKDFVANVSHELRTPLTVLVGYLETLLDHDVGDSPRRQRVYQQMQLQTDRMQHLLSDLLLLARLEASDHVPEIDPIDVAELSESILHDARALPPFHRFDSDIAPNLQLHGSYTELRSAFSNLVFNAVKYTPTDGDIHLRAWQDSEGVHFSVRDTGIGIDAKHLSRLTERFYRVDASRSLATGGTGLGLAIVKHVLLRHKGHLEIDSQPGRGSTFTCHFPHEIALNREPDRLKGG